MWSRKYPVNIVTHSDSWFKEYALKINDAICSLGILSTVCHSHHEVVEDSIALYLSYQKIVPIQFINKTYKSIVVHASDLPNGKGFSPWVWQVLEGKNEIPICLFEMVEKLDAGPVIIRDNLILQGTELLSNIRNLLASKISEIILRYLTQEVCPQALPQVGMGSIYKKRSPIDSRIDIDKSIKEQFNLLRTVDNDHYPAFFEYKGIRYILTIREDL